MKSLPTAFLPALLFLPLFMVLIHCAVPDAGGGDAQVIYHNGSFYAGGKVVPDQALAVVEGRIEELGPADQVIARWRGAGTVMGDLEGGVVYPGLFDSLGCIFKLATSLNRVNLLHTHSFQEVVELVKKEAQGRPEGTWIVGMGWDQNLWNDHALPSHEALSRAVPDHPVWLWRVDVMCGLANRKAMEVCRIDEQTEAPLGGVISKDEEGKLTGIFYQNAVGLIEDRMPAPSRSEVKRRLLQAQAHCFSRGLTGVFVPGLERYEIGLLKEMVDEGTWQLPICLSYRSGGDPDALAGLVPLTDYKGIMDARGVTIFLDGGLGSRGAALMDDYTDEPINRGILNYTPEQVETVARAAYEAGFQLSFHCVGDRAVKVALDAVEKVFPPQGAPQRRWRIEHSQMVHPRDRERYCRLGIIPSMQPYHCPSDMDWARNRVGPERLNRLYNWRAFADLGLPIAGGSFFPVEPAEPCKAIYAAVTTMKEDGTPPGGYLPEARLTRREALDLFTRNAAHAVHQEDRRGSLEQGKVAHLTVYDRDMMQGPPGEILQSQITRTVVRGKVVYRR